MDARIVGNKIDLKAPELTDSKLCTLVDFNQNSEALKWTGRNYRISNPINCKKWIEGCMTDENKYTFFIHDKRNRFIGTCDLNLMHACSSNAELGILIGAPYVNEGYGTETIQLLLKFAFDELRLHRVMLRLDLENERALHVYEKCGFKECGLEHETSWIEGKWHDTLTMEILDREYYGEQNTTSR